MPVCSTTSMSSNADCSESIESDSVTSQPSLLDHLHSDLCRERKVDIHLTPPVNKTPFFARKANCDLYTQCHAMNSLVGLSPMQSISQEKSSPRQHVWKPTGINYFNFIFSTSFQLHSCINCTFVSMHSSIVHFHCKVCPEIIVHAHVP